MEPDGAVGAIVVGLTGGVVVAVVGIAVGIAVTLPLPDRITEVTEYLGNVLLNPVAVTGRLFATTAAALVSKLLISIFCR